MPTRSSAPPSEPKFVRVDKSLSKYTKKLNKHQNRPIQWGEPGPAHTKGLILVGIGEPAVRVSVPNHIALEHAARDPAFTPGSEAAALVDAWEEAVRKGTWSARLERASDEEDEEPETLSTAAARRSRMQHDVQQLQKAADHRSLVVLAKAFEGFAANAKSARRERAEELAGRLFALDAALVKHETSRLGTRSLKQAAAHAREKAAPLLCAVLRAWRSIAETCKDEVESDDDMPGLKDHMNSESEGEEPIGLAASIAELAAAAKREASKAKARMAAMPPPPPAKNTAKNPFPPADPLTSWLADAGLERFGPALAAGGISGATLHLYSIEEIEDVVGRPFKGLTRTKVARLLGVDPDPPPAPAKTPLRKSKPVASPIPFIVGLEDSIECDACGALGEPGKPCETCGKIVHHRRLRRSPRELRQAMLEAGKLPESRVRGKQPMQTPQRGQTPQPLKELSGLPILTHAFDELTDAAEIEEVARDWIEKLGKAMSSRTSKADGFGSGAGSLEVVLEELEMLCALGVKEGFFEPEQLRPDQGNARALRMHARGLAIQIAKAPTDNPSSAGQGSSSMAGKTSDEQQSMTLQYLLNASDKGRKSGALDYESSLARLATLQQNPKAVEALSELAEEAKLDKEVADKLHALAEKHPEIAPCLLGGGASVRLPTGTPTATLAACLVSIRDRLIQEVGMGATKDMPGGLDATAIAKAAFEGKLSEVEWKKFFVSSGDDAKEMSNETKAALALKGLLPPLEDLLAYMLVGDTTTESTLKQLRVRMQNAKQAGCSTLEQVKNVVLTFFEHHDKQWKAFLNGSKMPTFKSSWKKLSEENANVKRFLARTEPGAADQGELKRMRDLEAKVVKLEEALKTGKDAVSECNKRIGRLEAMCKAGFEAAQVDTDVLKSAAAAAGSGGERGGGKGGGRGGGKGGGKGGRGGASASASSTSTKEE
jgi:hypothetical protein